jgi:hypothetical protein
MTIETNRFTFYNFYGMHLVVHRTVCTTINSGIDKTDTTLSTFVRMLLVALHISTPFLGHPQAHVNADVKLLILRLKKQLGVICVTNIATTCYKLGIRRKQIKQIIKIKLHFNFYLKG